MIMSLDVGTIQKLTLIACLRLRHMPIVLITARYICVSCGWAIFLLEKTAKRCFAWNQLDLMSMPVGRLDMRVMEVL